VRPFALGVLEQRVGRHLAVAVVDRPALRRLHQRAADAGAPRILRYVPTFDERHRRRHAAVRIGPQRQFQHADDRAIPLGDKDLVRQQWLAARHEITRDLQPQVVFVGIRPQRCAHGEPGVGVGFGCSSHFHPKKVTLPPLRGKGAEP
jgi:hypothetical protein